LFRIQTASTVKIHIGKIICNQSVTTIKAFKVITQNLYTIICIVNFKYFVYTTYKGMSKYTDTDSFEAQVSKMGHKRVINVPRDRFNDFKKKVKVIVSKKPKEKP
jgi:hypothetical protein